MILFVPDCHKNNYQNNRQDAHSIEKETGTGYGHLVRCIKMAIFLGGDILLDESMCAFAKDLLYHYQQSIKSNMRGANKSTNKSSSKKINIISEPNSRYDAVVIDKREIQKEDIQCFSSYGLIIGIDAGGEGRAYVHYTIDTLKNILDTAPNKFACGGSIDPFLERKQQWSSSCKHILFYTDGAYISKEIAFLESILKQQHHCKITIITNDISAYSAIARTYTQLTMKSFHIEYITKHIQDYDVCITHFGISAYEAIAAKVPVILLNKSDYHHSLSKVAKFPRIFSYITPKKTDGYDMLAMYMQNIIQDELVYADLIMETLTMGEYESIAQETRFVGDYIKDIIKYYKIANKIANKIASKNTGNTTGNANGVFAEAGRHIPVNPWKGIALDKAVYRNEEKTVFFCEDTEQWHQLSFSKDMPLYDDNYFFDAYKQQYGRTYIEDFSSILYKMRIRMRYIQKFLAPQLRAKYSNKKNIHTGKKYIKYHKDKNNPIACDIGAAYGTMLQASSEYGYVPIGIEINKKAVVYAKKIIRAEMIAEDIEEKKLSDLLQKKNNAVVIISAFFVIEHLKNLECFLDEVKKTLEKGGVIAFSVPNGAGISMRNNKEVFFQASPLDHFSIFTPKGLSIILKKAGFAIKKIHITGHHPERFSNRFPNRFKVPRYLRFFALFISKLFGLGDTFEIYAVKEW